MTIFAHFFDYLGSVFVSVFSLPGNMIDPPTLAKNLGVPRKMYEMETDIIPIKEKFWQKGIKTKKSFLFRKIC